MSGHDKNAGQTEANILSDEAIRRCLLGCADPVELAKFEALLMLDDEFERRVHRLELELADDFSFGQLSSEEQRLFTSHFLVTPGRVRQVAVSDALRQSISSKSTKQTKQAAQPWYLGFLNLFASDRPFGSAALAGVTLLIFGALFLLSQKAPPVRLPVISKQQPATNPATNTEKQFAHPTASQSPPEKSATDLNTKPEVLTIALQPDSNTGSNSTVQLPKGEVASVRLELLIDVESSASTTYQAGLMTADGEQVANFSELKLQSGSQPKVVVDVPAQLLKNGSYYVELKQTSEAATEDSKRYSFVVRQD